MVFIKKQIHLENYLKNIRKNMIQEQWKIIEEFPNYMVSDLGNVKRIKTNKILKADSVKGGYLRVKLYNKDNVKKVLIHRIVCQSFIP